MIRIWRAGWAGSLLLVLGIFSIYAWLPADGATGDLESFTAQGFRVQWLLEERPGGLRVGDLIVKAGGYTVDDWLGGAPRGPEWRTHGVVTYQILRNGQALELKIRLAPVSFLSILARWTSQLLGALAFFLIGTFVFWKHPEESSARLFMLLCVAVALQYWGDAYNFQYSSLPWRWPLWIQLVYEHGTYAIGIASICYFALVFPTRHPLVKRFPRLVPVVVYGSYFVIVGGAMALSPTWNTALLTGSRAAWLATILLVGVAIAAGVRSVRTARDPVTRAQTRWILWTCAVGLVVLMPGYVLPLLLTGGPLLPHPLIMLVIAAMPVSLAFAILRHRLFDIEVVINRSLVYGTLTVLLAAVFGASLFAFSQVFQVLMGDQQLVIAMTASALIVGALFQPMRRHLQRFVDQRFFGIHIDYQKKAGPPLARTIGAPARPQLDDYTELRLVGQGGAAAVYSARHPSLNRTVAIKILSEHLIQESDFRRRFEREAQIIASLRHPSIVQVYDFGEQEGLYYMVMEYVDGPDLGSLLHEQGRMPLAKALPLVCDIASALDYAHEQDLVHRDIKPSNVMLDPISEVEGTAPYRAVLMDFGLAKIVGGNTRLTQPGMVGTLSYIAPEQIQAAADVDRRADIYAFGVMTYEMLVGELPFKRQDPGALLIAHLTQPPPDPRSLVPELSDNVVCALQRALAKNPNERYPSAGAFARALKEPGRFGKFG